MNLPDPVAPAYSPILASLVRTFVPLFVGMIATWAVRRFGVTIDNDTVTAAVTAGISFVYYAVVRFLEAHKGAFGWLLGLAAQPTRYVKKP
jgi:hypothetical protein